MADDTARTTSAGIMAEIVTPDPDTALVTSAGLMVEYALPWPETATRPPSRVVGNGMQAIIAPVGRAPYLVPLRLPPVFSSQAFGGYAAATLVQARVNSALSARLLYADVTLYGKHGACWKGVVKETERDGALHCVGYHEVLSWHTATALGPATTHHIMVESLIGQFPAYVPSSAAFVQTSPLTLTASVTLDPSNIASQLQSVASYSDWEYGFYFERINGVQTCAMHYAPPSTVPDYFVTLSAEDAAAFMGDSLENMASSIITTWGTTNTRTTTTDTDASHYLVAIGRGKTMEQSSPNTANAGDAALIAAARLVKRAKTKAGKIAANLAYRRAQFAGVHARGRMQMGLGYSEAGASTTSRIQLPSGLEAYPPDIRASSLVRLIGLPSGFVDLRLQGVECVGDSSCSLDLGADSGRLGALLARVS